MGGAERHLALIAPRLRDHGWQPTIYCLTRKGDFANLVEARGVKVIGPLFDKRPELFIWRYLNLAASCLKLFFILLFQRPRIVHFFLPLAYTVGAPLSLLAGIKIRVMSRRSLNLYQRNHPIIRELEKLMHRLMTAIIGNSRAVVRDLVNEGCEHRRTGLIYNGIDVATYESAVPVSSWTGHDLVIVCVANLIPYKGHADLFEALAGVHSDLPKNWILLCAGRDDGWGAELERMSLRLGLDKRIRMLGSCADVPALIKAADIGVLCSHEEGFANTILEGMAAGKPMIVTDVGGNREAVIDGVTGLVVPPKNPRALGQAIVSIASDSVARRKMGEAAHKHVSESFSINACVSNYVRLYGGLSNGERVADIKGIGILQ